MYCGSSTGHDPVYAHAASQLGASIADRGLTLVYGGGNVGLMGTVADAALRAGGRVHGVITEALLGAEVAHRQLTELEIVPTMHDRKARMAELADGFVALPGGFGTFEELFEVLTWTQLGIHSKPIVLVNVAGYWDPLLSQTRHATEQGFMKPDHQEVLRSSPTVDGALVELFRPLEPTVPKWVDQR